MTTIAEIETEIRIEREFVFPRDVVLAFADLIGDHNPLHVDPEAGRRSRFGACIVHGALTSSVFSGMFASMMIEGTYMGSTYRFLAPVYIDEPVTGSVEVLRTRGRSVALQAMMTKRCGTVAVRGVGLVKAKRTG